MAHEILQSKGVASPVESLTPRRSSSDVLHPASFQVSWGSIGGSLRGSLGTAVGNASPVLAAPSPRISASSPRLLVAGSSSACQLGLKAIHGNPPVASSPRLSVSRNPGLSVSSSSSLPNVSVAANSSVPQLETTCSLATAQQIRDLAQETMLKRTPWMSDSFAVPVASEDVSPTGSIGYRSILRPRGPSRYSRPVSPRTSFTVVASSHPILDTKEHVSQAPSTQVQRHEASSPLDPSDVADQVAVSMEQGQTDSSPNSQSPRVFASLKLKKEWVPAIATPTYFSHHDDRRKSTGISSNASPTSSACSLTPRRRSGKCYQDLYDDAAKRNRRRADSENHIRTTRESHRCGTRRYKSSDARNALQRTDDLLRKKTELLDVSKQTKKKREEQQLEECTFKPELVHHTRPLSHPPREQDEIEMERHLRQLAHKQLDVKSRLVKLESEWIKLQSRRNELFTERFKAVQNEKQQEVFTMLSSKEGQEYYLERVQRLVDSSSTSNIEAQSAILYELLEQQRQLIRERVGEEVDKELQLPSHDLDFWTRRNVLLESLEAIEARAAPSLQMLSQMPEARAVIKASSFHEGLAKHMRDNLPDPRNEHVGSSETNDAKRTTASAQPAPATLSSQENVQPSTPATCALGSSTVYHVVV